LLGLRLTFFPVIIKNYYNIEKKILQENLLLKLNKRFENTSVWLLGKSIHGE